MPDIFIAVDALHEFVNGDPARPSGSRIPLQPAALRALLLHTGVSDARKKQLLDQISPRTIEDPATGNTWTYHYGQAPVLVSAGQKVAQSYAQALVRGVRVP